MSNLNTTSLNEKTHSALEDGKSAVRNLPKGDDLKAMLTEKKDLAVAWAKENPLTAAAIGVGVGFILGGIVRRVMNRRND